MANVKVCDACGKPISRAVLKLYLVPRPENGNKRFDHNAYDKHADIGECCAERFQRAVRWQKRKSVPQRKTKLAALKGGRAA